MAFDKPTRNRLAKFVSDARGVIADEFTEQFQSLYGISAKGEIAPLDKLGHLDDAGLATAALLRERIDYLEKTHPDDKDGTRAAVARLAREQAFTILNRLAAIRMAEKRGLIVESVGQGYQSKGFKVFETVAGSALGDTYHRYRRYLFCLFDELAIDLGVLFDRRSPQALLFPREPALLAMLDLLHAADLEPLWAEDETIGWIYQYYNDPDERKKMRKESAAPRNSRELAVRNQFFTPRYVVEFLTDNTLGRIWYEMCQGRTALREQCRYLVRRPTEIFLEPGESAPEEVASGQCSVASEGEKTDHRPLTTDHLSQEELLRQPVHIPHRPIKDPREIRLLDPACGSMHFGLYAFDLFETIYEEAWEMQLSVVGGQWSEEIHEQAEILSRIAGLAEGHGSGGSNLPSDEGLSEGGNLRSDQPTASGSRVGAVEHSGGTGEELDPAVPSSSVDRLRVADGDRNANLDRPTTAVSESASSGGSHRANVRDREDVERLVRRAFEKANWPLTTDHRPLFLDYPSKDEFLKDVPRLIIEHNIHGIDIDPRAVQIAGLSLWLRAQKAWQAQGVKPADRPRVRRSNVVCAEPMPGSPEMLEDFVATLDPPLLGELVKTVFDKMQLAGEAGSLLKIEEEIRSAIEEAKREWLKTLDELPGLEKSGRWSVASGQQGNSTGHRPLTTDYWETVEVRLLDALRAYAEQADAYSYQRRLFADDAARGFAFIDLCRKRYDAVVMNPPFGDASIRLLSLLANIYHSTRLDLFASFCERTSNFASPSGIVGALTPRDGFFKKTLGGWREFMLSRQLNVVADLGIGVLDAATVRVAAYTFQGSSVPRRTLFLDLVDQADREGALRDAITSRTQNFSIQLDAFKELPLKRFLYWLPHRLWEIYRTCKPLENVVCTPRYGLATFDDFRFCRLCFEVPPETIGQNGKWVFMSKGGDDAVYGGASNAVVLWENHGTEMAEVNRKSNGQIAQTRRASKFYFKPALSFSNRSVAFGARWNPANYCFSMRGPAVIPLNEEVEYLLGYFNSRVTRLLIEMQTASQTYTTGVLKDLRWVVPDASTKSQVKENAGSIFRIVRSHLSSIESDPFFRGVIPPGCVKPSEAVACLSNQLERWNEQVSKHQAQIDALVAALYGVTDDVLDRCIGAEGTARAPFPPPLRFNAEPVDILLHYIVGCSFRRYSGETTEATESLLSAAPSSPPAEWPLQESHPILADDPSHKFDIISAFIEALSRLFPRISSDSALYQIEEMASGNLRTWCRNCLFRLHLSIFSAFARQAPIYWPLSTKSGSYTLWLYYHRLTDQTLHTCLADFLDPKIKKVQSELDSLRAEGRGQKAGESQEFLDELNDLRDEIERVIKLPWKPNLNDGVLITASPLHKLFRLPKWQKDLKKCWDKLEKGDYDWAHLAHTIWPQRVEKVCEKDRSIAIAHGLEHLCKVEPPKPKKKRSKKAAKDEGEDDVDEPQLIEED